MGEEEKSNQKNYNDAMRAIVRGQFEKLSQLRPLALLDVYVTAQENTVCSWTFRCSSAPDNANAAAQAAQIFAKTTDSEVLVAPLQQTPSPLIRAPADNSGQSLEGGGLAIPAQGNGGLLIKKIGKPMEQPTPLSLPPSGQALQTNNAPLRLSPEAQRRIVAAVLNSPAENTTAKTPATPASGGLRPDIQAELDKARATSMPVYTLPMPAVHMARAGTSPALKPDLLEEMEHPKPWYSNLPDPLPRLAGLFVIVGPGIPMPSSRTTRGTPHAVGAMAGAVRDKGTLATLLFISCTVIWFYLAYTLIALSKQLKVYAFLFLAFTAPVAIALLVSVVQRAGEFALNHVGWALALGALLAAHFVSVLALLVGVRHIVKTPTEVREAWESLRHLFAFRLP